MLKRVCVPVCNCLKLIIHFVIPKLFSLNVCTQVPLLWIHRAGDAYTTFININPVELHSVQSGLEQSHTEVWGQRIPLFHFRRAKDSFPLSFRFSTHRNVPWPNNAAAKFIWGPPYYLTYWISLHKFIRASIGGGVANITPSTPRRLRRTSDIATSRTQYVYFVDAVPLSALIKELQVQGSFITSHPISCMQFDTLRFVV